MHWVPDVLPELLFVAAMIDEYEHPEPAWRYLEALDPFVGDVGFLDGHISSFTCVASEQRGEA